MIRRLVTYPLPMRWRLLLSSPATGAENMALDHALRSYAGATGECVARVYTWSRPTLSFGRHQSARGIYMPDAIDTLGYGVVRRPSGGRAVLHDREVTYAVAAPDLGQGSLSESYARINRLLVGALRRMGIDATVARSTGRAPRPDGAPCFDAPTAGEIMVNGRKLVGSAQCRGAGGVLQHGSILLDDDQHKISALLVRPRIAPPRPATLRELLGRTPRATEVAHVLFDVVRECEDQAAAEMVIDDELATQVAALRDHYADDVWTWQR
ncbi:MAG: hypothetical protein NVS4B3_20190 [Gemmatimonadaceae bacterium]